MPILTHLATKAEAILGSTPLERALVRQWVAFQFGCLDLEDKKELDLHFKRLDSALETSSYLAGETQTAADVLLFHGVHGALAEMGFQEKERYVHLSRWFRAQQQDPRLRRGKPAVTFSRTRLY
jgi:glutathione S-transferase